MLHVYKASAGSGKTYNLTFFYLKICFEHLEDPGYFQHILAMTFTNDATAEMKSRIIKELKLLATENENAEHLQNLMEACSLSKQQVHGGAKSILRYMMQYYTRFSISTIDSFFQRVLKIFMRELKLEGGYEVELDTDLVLDKAMEAFYEDLDEEAPDLKWIEMILSQRMAEGKSYNFQTELLKLGKILFHEDVDRKLPSKDSGELQSIYQRLQDKIYSLEGFVLKNVKQLQNVLDQYDLHPADFKGGKTQSFVVTWINKIVDLQSAQDNHISKLLNMEASPDAWYAKSASADIQSKIESAFPSINELLAELKGFLENRLVEYYSLIEKRRNFPAFAFLSTLDKYIQDYGRREQKILLSRTSLLLQKVIDLQIMPFFYERLGQRYHHILLDEFQDTSRVQWENLNVLVEHALSDEGNHSLIVGDVKQAIYRWRNGDWRTLQVDLKEEYGQREMLKSQPLKYNFRSYEEVISFNNELFELLPEQGMHYVNEFWVEGQNGSYNPQMIRDVFENHRQGLHDGFLEKRKGGYIQMDAIVKRGRSFREEQDDKKWELLHQQIIDIIDRGYHMSDICILVRKAKQGTEVAEKLFAWRKEHKEGHKYFQCSSKEVLQLSSSLAVQAVIAFFKLLRDDTDKVATAEWHQAISELENRQTDYKGFGNLPAELKELLSKCETQSLWEISDHIIEEARLGQNKGEIPFLQHLQDEILSYMQKEGGHIGEFLDWWEEKGYQSSVLVPEGQDAIRIITIHKSKGLEFPIVILPYANWEISELTAQGNKDVWIWAQKVDMEGEVFKSYPLNFSKKLRETEFQEYFNDELVQEVIDNLNLLYVATTRAQKELYLHMPEVSTPQNDKYKSVGDLILSGTYHHFSFELVDEEIEHYTFRRGEKGAPEHEILPNDEWVSLSEYRAAKSIPPLSGRFARENIEGEEVKALTRGRALHWLFERIESEQDISLALSQAVEEGRIDKEDRNVLKDQIESLFAHREIGPLLKETEGILHEREILLEKGELMRPDRVLLGKNETKVIDFKTGGHYPKNEIQLKSYLNALSRMNYPNIKGYLLYLDSAELKEYI